MYWSGIGDGGNMSKRIGVYPGTFDPITLGHMDIIERGAKLVDELIIGVTTNIAKSPMFDDDERIAMVKREVAAVNNAHIRVVGFNSLLMDFAEAQGASVVIRGIRGVTDFEYEYQLTGMNRQLNDRIETVFLMADVALQPIASRLVKEIALYGGDIRKFVTPAVRDDVVARVEKTGRPGGQ
jgi:pantetheine-phosphate adenylyltransferase